MAGKAFRDRLEALLAQADVRIGGDRPWDIRVLNEALYPRLAASGSLGAGESYMDGWWECERLDEMICRVLRVRLDRQLRPVRDIWLALRARLWNLQHRGRAFQVGRQHYDLGFDLFQAMLDRRMIYSCGYWRRAQDLDEAQEHKLDLIARKLALSEGMRVLDIGCGWGGALCYFAERYGISGVGITVSRDQYDRARQLCAGQPLEIRLQDYRELDGRFDRIFSIGMFEHVGYRNYRRYFEIVRRCLKDGGLFLLHTIGGRVSRTRTDPWIDRYIFPNGMLPSARQITTAAERLLCLEDWHNFPQDYDRTLLAWHENFMSAWDDLRAAYDERFRRMWRYYLLSCAGSFRAGVNQLWQIVFSRDGLPGGYRAVDIR
ncbi:MAG: cyclopropane fatty acyl phospholipid synthase [Gammaproteobacteria bacterium]|nr:MAG: cyclopropane fatty acyl phospholipid synthase [Gammaproteobacteria bacterium]